MYLRSEVVGVDGCLFVYLKSRIAITLAMTVNDDFEVKQVKMHSFALFRAPNVTFRTSAAMGELD